jgi:uncharacterized protein (TIGR04255 family)
MNKLPSKLSNEPLIDVAFEMRFKSDLQASSFVPGLLLAKLGERAAGARLERMPAAEMPLQLRASDPNLRYLPLVKITLGNYAVMVSDYSVVISCIMPYVGWEAYKLFIKETVTLLSTASLFGELERHSLKYVDLIEAKLLADQLKLVNLELSIAGHEVKQEATHVRVEIPENGHIKVLQILTDSALVNDPGRSGTIIDVDVIRTISFDVQQYLANLDSLLEEIHDINKRAFFNCLTKEALESLGPEYE